MNYIVLIGVVGLGVWTAVLAIKKKPTLSQRYQKLFPTWLDIIIFSIGLAGICFWKYMMPELNTALAIVMAGFWGHVTFPNKERFVEW